MGLFPGFVKGIVRDQSTGLVITGATVRGGNIATSTTNSDGQYLLQLPDGDHDIICSKYGYNRDTQNVAVESFEITLHNIGMD